MKRWPEATLWQNSKTWKIYSKILEKQLNFKKKKFQRKDQTIYKGNRIGLSWAVSKATYRTKHMKQHFLETKRNYESRIL